MKGFVLCPFCTTKDIRIRADDIRAHLYFVHREEDPARKLYRSIMVDDELIETIRRLKESMRPAAMP